MSPSKTEQMMNHIIRACDTSMPRRRNTRGYTAVYWWNEEIARLRSECHRARRLYQRSRGRATFTEQQQQYKSARRNLKVAIIRSKRRSFNELCNEADQNPWGMAYQVVMKKLKSFRSIAPTCPRLLESIVSGLFPRRQETPVENDMAEETCPIPAVTVEEVVAAANRFGDKKSPGLDGIPNVALKTAIRTRPNMFASCLNEGIFPDRWKKQKLVLIPKGSNASGDPSSFRPLCMLDTAGKVLERIIANRLEVAIENAGGLAEHQYGFRRSRSTIDAIRVVVNTAKKAIEGRRWRGGAKRYCAVITLDVRNAFNSANWNHILEALRNKSVPTYVMKIVTDYLRQRILIYDTDDGPKEYTVTGGVPQGSVLGPLLWNVMYDEILNISLPEEATIVGFADDVAIVVVAKLLEEVVQLSNDTIEIVQRWLQSVGLELAEHKTEAVLISSRKKRETITLTIGGHQITSKHAIKYLGVMIDARLSFKALMHFCQTMGDQDTADASS